MLSEEEDRGARQISRESADAEGHQAYAGDFCRAHDI